MSVVYINSYQFSAAAPALTTWDIGITTSDGNWSLRTESTCNYDVDWGDGQTDTNVSATGTFVKSHTYASSGSYTVKVTLNSGVFRPRFDYTTGSSNTEVVSLGATPPGWSFGTNLSSAWLNCTGLTSVSLLGINSVTNFSFAWFGCSNLVNFPANFFDNWTATPGNNCFYYAWFGCTSLSATSVENILNSIATSGRSPSGSGSSVTITIDYNASSGTPSISSAVSTLKSRGWIIVLNGVTQ